MENYNAFRKSLAFVLQHEGGYSNDPSDPGGETKWGISKRSHPDLDVAALTPEQAASIYATEYWDKCGCDAIQFPYCTVVFDSAVQHGVGRALDWLRNSTDVNDYIQKRKMFYYNIVQKNPSQRKYLNGWINRVLDLLKFVQIQSSEV